MPNAPESTRQVLNNAVFQDIRRRVDFHAELLKRIREGLPTPIANHCRYCVAREDGGVVVYVDSQAFASQLRFRLPALLARLNAAGDLSVKQIVLRNLPLTTPSVVTKAMEPMKVPPPETIEMVKASSLSAPSDDLAKALARLGTAMERYAGKRP
ncbi:hypothetical protein ANRL2_01227 [Anaerolineae bacterium]|nr:hypothetical protein ANRL2_01227 [Anaerolineae bacterium]